METRRTSAFKELSPVSILMTPERTNWHLDSTCREEVIHTTEEAIPIVEKVSAALAGLHFARKDLFEFRLALEEALVNGLKHGNQNDPNKQVRVRYCLRPEAALA